MEAPVFISTEELAERWGMGASTLVQWRQQGRGPVFTKIGGRVRYELAIVEAWERARAVQSPADYGSIDRQREAAQPLRSSEVQALAEHYQAITRLVPLRAIRTAEQEAAAKAARLALLASGAQGAAHPLAELLGLLEARIDAFQGGGRKLKAPSTPLG